MEKYISQFYESKSITDEMKSANSVVMCVSIEPEKFVDLLECVLPYISDPDRHEEEIVKSYRLIGEVLQKVRNLVLTPRQQELLADHFLGHMRKLSFVDVASRCLEVLITSHMLKSPESARVAFERFAGLLEGDYWLTGAYVQPIRHRVYSIMNALLKSGTGALTSDSEGRFIRLALEHTSDERDPRNLFVVLSVWQQVLFFFSARAVEPHTETIFDQISVYFPIIFKNRSATSSITVDDLNDLLNRCLSHEAMVERYVGLIFGKLSEEDEEVRRGSVRGLVHVLEGELSGAPARSLHVVRQIAEQLRGAASDVREMDEVKRCHVLLVGMLRAEHLETSCVYSQDLLASHLRHMVETVGSAASSVDGVYFTEVMRWICRDGPFEVKCDMIFGLLETAYGLLKIEKHSTMKVLLEHVVQICAFNISTEDGLARNVERRRKDEKEMVLELMKHMMESESLDMRMMGIMCVKICMTYVDLGKKCFAYLKSVLMQNARTRGKLESIFSIDAYFLHFASEDVSEFGVWGLGSRAEEERKNSQGKEVWLYYGIKLFREFGQNDEKEVERYLGLVKEVFDGIINSGRNEWKESEANLVGVLPVEGFCFNRNCVEMAEALAMHAVKTRGPIEEQKECAELYKKLAIICKHLGANVSTVYKWAVSEAGIESSNISMLRTLIRIHNEIEMPAECVDFLVKSLNRPGCLDIYMEYLSQHPLVYYEKVVPHMCANLSTCAPSLKKLLGLGIEATFIPETVSSIIRAACEAEDYARHIRILFGHEDEAKSTNGLLSFRLYKCYTKVRDSLEVERRASIDVLLCDVLDFDDVDVLETIRQNIEKESRRAEVFESILNILIRRGEKGKLVFSEEMVKMVVYLYDLKLGENGMCIKMIQLLSFVSDKIGSSGHFGKIMDVVERWKSHKKRAIRRCSSKLYNLIVAV